MSTAGDTLEAVLAFQKVHGLRAHRPGRRAPLGGARTGGAARARYGGDHIEVDKQRQVLMLVRGGRVALVAHVSTGATGNTPVGRWHVYRKVRRLGLGALVPDVLHARLRDPRVPEVPAYPASHGCVRVPMWLAPRLFADHPYGTTVIVY